MRADQLETQVYDFLEKTDQPELKARFEGGIAQYASQMQVLKTDLQARKKEES